MPTRILREGIITSERINSLSFGAELFYRRLMSAADDYGRYFANPAILRANCYPLKLDSVSEKDVARFLQECVSIGVIKLYSGGKYLQIVDFRQQTRSKSKFPEPDVDNEPLINCKSPVQRSLSLVGVGDVVGVGDEDGVLGGVAGNGKEATPSGFDDFWKAYPKKVGKGDAEKKFAVAIRKVSLPDMLKAIERQSSSEAWRKDGGRYIPNPSTWLNQERWHDEVRVEVKPVAVGGQF